MSRPGIESKYDTTQLEKASSKDSSQNVRLKLDPHGYPLRPQPSDDPLGEMKLS